MLELCVLDKIIGSTTSKCIVSKRLLRHGDLVIESSSQNYYSLGSASVALDLFPRTLEKCSEKVNGWLTSSHSLTSSKLQKCLKCTWELSVLFKADLVLSRQRFRRAQPFSEGP
jgi:RAB protein geranylgeranyltransferase component A